MKQFVPSDIVSAYTKKGYRLKTGILELNLYGVRNKGSQANTFDDVVGALYKDEAGTWRTAAFPATTDPGTYYRENPINVDGTAIIAPGQYLDCYQVGLHRGYEAFQQVGKMGYVRDKNKNKILDFALYLIKSNIIYGIFATNIHYSSPVKESTIVGNWSAGCQVMSMVSSLKNLLNLAKEGIRIYKYKNRFDYALFESDEV